MSITIPFRSLLRAGVLGAVGRVASISRSVHMLNGHIIGPDGEKSQAAFRRLLSELSKEARLTRVEEACELIGRRSDLDRPHIAFTFDDGFEDCYRYIAPVLEEYGVNGAFFVNPGFVHGDGKYRQEFYARAVPNIPARAPMTGRMIFELADRGHIIGAHTTDHIRMTSTDAGVVDEQIVQCRTAVESISAKPCKWFAWAFGKYPDISTVALDAALSTYEVVFSSDGYERYCYQDARVLNRRHFECDWPAAHVRYFLSRKRAY